MGVPSNQNTCANPNNHNPKTTARTSSDFGAQRRNCTAMGTISNQNSYYIPAPSKRISVLFGSFVTKSLDDPVYTRWIPHQTRMPVQTQTTTTLKQQQGHRVISKRSEEIVPRWLLHQTRTVTTCRRHQSASRYYLAPSSPNHSMTLCTPGGYPIKPEYPAQTRTTTTLNNSKDIV